MDVPADPRPPRPPGRSRLIVANLDAELDWARAHLGTYARLPGAVISVISATGACMAVFGRAGDRLWLPGSLSTERFGSLLSGLGLEVVTGALPTCDEVIAWGCTEAVAEVGADGDPRLCAELNDRRFSLALERPLAAESPVPRIVSDVGEFTAAMLGWPHPHPWVLKATLSASGRSRLKRRGPPDTEAETHARRLFDRFGVMILEPWLDRVADFGTVGRVDDDGVHELSSHGLEVDGNGVFRAVVLGADVPPDVLDEARRAAEQLQERGYRGPFAIDSFTYRTRDGEALRGICEINARLSFGHVARAAVHRFARELGGGERWRLEVLRQQQPSEGATVLVRPSSSDPTAVQLRRWD